MKYLSLFSGIGGFELGIEKAYVDVSTPAWDKQGWLGVEEMRAVTVNVIKTIISKLL